MSTSYSCAAFFGTFAERGTRAGDMLDDLLESHGGTPAAIGGCEGVEINMHGSQATGDLWFSVETKSVGEHYAMRDDVERPAALREGISSAPIIWALEVLEIDPSEVAPVGWYFAASAG